MKRLFRRPSPAMVIAIVALFAALGGTAVGAKVLGKKQVKNIANTQANNVFSQRSGTLTRVQVSRLIPAGGIDTVTATCPPGQGVVSGGAIFISGGGEIFIDDTEGSRNSWVVGGDNFDQPISAEVRAIAYCTPSGKAVTASSAANVDNRVDEAVALQKARHGF